MSIQSDLADLYRRDITRLAQELHAFPDDAALWRKLEGVNNPAGNLVLHIEGNLREFIGRRLGGLAYDRDRAHEFAGSGITRAELAARLDAIRESIPAAIAGLSDAALDAVYPENVLGVPMSTRLFLIHLLAHLNLHMGQVDYLRRIMTDTGAVVFAKLASGGSRA